MATVFNPVLDAIAEPWLCPPEQAREIAYQIDAFAAQRRQLNGRFHAAQARAEGLLDALIIMAGGSYLTIDTDAILADLAKFAEGRPPHERVRNLLARVAQEAIDDPDTIVIRQ